MDVECECVRKLKAMQEVWKNGIRETFIEKMQSYIDKNMLSWDIIDYTDYPELIGISIDTEDSISPEDVSEMLQTAIKEIGLDWLIVSYDPRVNFCYVELIKPEWMKKYILGSEYEGLLKKIEKYKKTIKEIIEKLESI